MTDSLPNPFAITQRRRRRPVLAALQGLAVLIGLLAAVLIVQSHTRQWLLQRWNAGFADLPAAEQLSRLSRIDQLGDLAIASVSRRVAESDDRVGQTAIDLLRKRQAQWADRDDQSLAKAHLQMLIGLEAVIDRLPAARQPAVGQLLNLTITQCSQRQAKSTAQTHRLAERLLERLPPGNLAHTASARATAEPQPADPQPSDRQPAVSSVAAPRLLSPQPLVASAASAALDSNEHRPVEASEHSVVTAAGVSTIRPEQTVHRVVASGDAVADRHPLAHHQSQP